MIMPASGPGVSANRAISRPSIGRSSGSATRASRASSGPGCSCSGPGETPGCGAIRASTAARVRRLDSRDRLVGGLGDALSYVVLAPARRDDQRFERAFVQRLDAAKVAQQRRREQVRARLELVSARDPRHRRPGSMSLLLLSGSPSASMTESVHSFFSQACNAEVMATACSATS